MRLNLHLRRPTFAKICSTDFFHFRGKRKKEWKSLGPFFFAFPSTNFFHFYQEKKRKKEWKNLGHFCACPRGKAVAKYFHSSHTFSENTATQMCPSFVVTGAHLNNGRILPILIFMREEACNFTYVENGNLLYERKSVSFSSPIKKTRKMCQQLKKLLHEKSK